MSVDKIAANLAHVRERIRCACERSGHKPESVRLIAVTKYVEAEVVRMMTELGMTQFGENRLQVAQPKIVALAGLPVGWHFIGRLQSNKARQVVSLFSEIHSVDRIELVQELNHQTKLLRENGHPKVLPVFLQVNISGEASKTGVKPEDTESVGEHLLDSKDLNWAGLMTMAPEVEEVEKARPVFAALRELRDRLAQKLGHPLPRLSMGMSHDFEVAIEEGATDVRIGSLLYEGL